MAGNLAVNFLLGEYRLMAKKRVAGQPAAIGRGKVAGQVASDLAVNFLLGKYRLMAIKPVDGQLAAILAATDGQHWLHGPGEF